MDNLTLAAAAEVVGISKEGLRKAIKKGHLSATTDDNGEYMVGAAEATRYRDSRQHKRANQKEKLAPVATNENSGLAVEVQVLRERCAQQEKQIRQLEQQISDMKEEHAENREIHKAAIDHIKLLTGPTTGKKGWFGFGRARAE